MHTNIGRSVWFLMVGAGVACFPAVSAFAQGPAAHTPAGTYQVSICEGVCAADGSNLLVAGLLVLEPQTFALHERLSEAGQRHLRQSNPWMLVALSETDRDPNVCFAPEIRPNAFGLARAMKTGITGWRSSEHGIEVRLWVSPDAGYNAVLRPDGPDLRGSGFVWSMGGQYREIDEMVTATYVGPPDLDRCLRVIESEAARGVTRN